jgi:L-fuculose-phosphate aldolase
MSHKKIRNGIIDTCLEMNRSGLNQGTSGNVSHRVDGGMLITPTSLPYDKMKPADIVEMNFDGTFSGRHRPSSEWRFHRDILKNRKDVNIVLHTHSVYTTTLAVHERGIPSFHYMVAVAGGFDIRCSPYACFGTQELSDYALKALEGRTACILGHHGLIVLANTFEKALWLATEVETLAKMYVHALAIGEPPRLSDKEMTQVQEQIKRMSYGQAPDLDTVKDSPKVKGAAVTAAKKAAPAKSASVAVSVKSAAPKAAATKAPAAKRPGRPAKAAKAPVMTATAIEKAPKTPKTSSKAPGAPKTSSAKAPATKTSAAKAGKPASARATAAKSAAAAASKAASKAVFGMKRGAGVRSKAGK